MRIDKLTSDIKTNTDAPKNLNDFYKWENSEDGQQALDKLYPSDERAEKLMEEHRKNLKEHGILPSSSKI